MNVKIVDSCAAFIMDSSFDSSHQDRESAGKCEEPCDIELYTNWGSVISTIKDNLPTINSDSEVSSFTEDSDTETMVFSRSDLSYVKQSILLSQKPLSAKLEVLETTDESSNASPSSLLFKRLQCKAKKHETYDMHIEGEEFPIYENDSVSSEIPNPEGGPTQPLDEEMMGYDLNNNLNCKSSTAENSSILPLKMIEDFDLDELMSSVVINKDGMLLDYHTQALKPESSTKVMDELVRLSAMQSRQSRLSDCSKKSTVSRGVIADVTTCQSVSTSNPELASSEPVTVYLDLRCKTSNEQPEIKTNKHFKSETLKKQRQPAALRESSTSYCSDDNEDNDSDRDEDDFIKWKEMRKRWKVQVTDNISAREEKQQQTSQIDTNSSSERNNHVHTTMTNNNIETSAKTDDTASTSILNNLSNREAEGIYERQRLKKCSATGESCELHLSNSVAKSKAYGKSIVLFAEEPKQDLLDTTNVYRSTDVVDPHSMSSKEAEKPYRNHAKLHADHLSCSTMQLKAAAEKVMEESKKRTAAQEEQVGQHWHGSNARDSYSILQNQRKQLPSCPVKLTLTTPALTLPFELKEKMHKIVERNYKKQYSEKEAKLFPLLYDKDVSFDPELLTIPATVDEKLVEKVVLLTFRLSSAGCVIMNRTAGGHRHIPVDPSNELSITYPLLVSWLLALIPDNPDKPHDPPCEDVFAVERESDLESRTDHTGLDNSLSLIEIPFNVVSLHQAWQEETQTIAMNAIVVPNFFYKPDLNNRRKKPKKKNAFLQVVWHFLQSNPIQEVCPWHSRPESPILYNYHDVQVKCSTKPMSTYINASNDPQLLDKVLQMRSGFAWKLFRNDDISTSCWNISSTLQTTVCLLQKESFTYPVCVLDLMLRLQSLCLDVAALRLTYVTRSFLQKNMLSHSRCSTPDQLVPCVAVAIRGKEAIKKLLEIVGPRDPILARMTDQGSLNALYGEQLSKRRGDDTVPTEMNVFHSPRGGDRAQQQLVTWFSGRFHSQCFPQNLSGSCLPNKAVALQIEKDKNNFNCKGSNDGIPCSLSTLVNPHLIASQPARLCLVVSPRFPPQYLGDVISIVSEQGFVMEGLKRMILNDKKLAAFCISSRNVTYFKPPLNLDLTFSKDYYEMDTWWLRPVTILLLSRENAVAHQAALISALQLDLIFHLVQPCEELLAVSEQCFHVVAYSDLVSSALNPMCKIPEVELTAGDFPQAFFSEPELEQVVVLSFIGDDMISRCGCMLQTILRGEFDLGNSSVMLPSGYSLVQEFNGFELLGIKFIPALSAQHAKELSPFEVGTQLWHHSISLIKANPVLMCVLRRVDAYHVLHALLTASSKTTKKAKPSLHDMKQMMSSTPEITYRQMKTFFCGKELFADNQCRPLLKYLPPALAVEQSLLWGRFAGSSKPPPDHKVPKQSKKKRKPNSKNKEEPICTWSGESIFSTVLSLPCLLISMLIIKPDAFPRHFVKILKQLHNERFCVVAAKMALLSEEQAYQIIPSCFAKMPGEQRIFISHMTSGPSLILCVQRVNAVRKLLDLAGPSKPTRSKAWEGGGALSCWRSEYGIDEFSNAIHVSESYLAACAESKLFFPEGLCCSQTVELKIQQIPAPSFDHIICQDKMKGREIRQGNELDVDCCGLNGMETQMVCVVLTASLLMQTPMEGNKLLSKSVPSYVAFLEQLVSQGYEICALRMVWMRQQQADYLYQLFGGKPGYAKTEMINKLMNGASLLLLIQRENGLILFDSIVSSFLKYGSYAQYSGDYLRTQTMGQTGECARFLFHRIDNNRSVFQVSHKRALEWKWINT